MRMNIVVITSLTTTLCFGQNVADHKNELAFGLGGIPSLTRSDSPLIKAGSGVAFQVNYARRLMESHNVAVYGEINFTASPLREVISPVATATRDFATAYITPGLRIKFLSASRISPYAAIGGGFGDYEQSTSRINGQPNSAPRQIKRGVFDFGGGFDIHLWRFLSLRGEARDYYTGSPAYNVSGLSGGQHNVIATGAFVLGWH